MVKQKDVCSCFGGLVNDFLRQQETDTFLSMRLNVIELKDCHRGIINDKMATFLLLEQTKAKSLVQHKTKTGFMTPSGHRQQTSLVG